jgi:perosamine synthetase
MSAVQAALGKSQLTRMHSVTLEKRRIGLLYDKLLSGDERIVMQPTETAYSKNKYWVVGLLFEKNVNARDVARRLRERGIDSRPFFYPLHKQPLLAKFNLDQQPTLPVSELLGHSGLYLPSFVGISDAEIEFCANGIRVVLDELKAR